MVWSTVNFGKHSGKTLPQIVFSDPDWFFWAIENGIFKGPLANQARTLNARARVIRIPENDSGDLTAEYYLHQPTGKFAHVEVVPVSRPHHEGSSPTFRKDVIDLSVPRQIAPYDKLGCKNLISSVKSVLFGSASVRMTKERCEAFFDDLANFRL
jgi:hypothetical protein